LSTTVRKKKNTDTRATAVTKLLALKNDYLNNPKRKKHTGQRQSKRTNKQTKTLKNSESPHQQKQTKNFPPSLSLQNLYSQTLPKLKIDYSRCFFV